MLPTLTMETSRRGVSVEEAIGSIADSEPDKFRDLFRRMRKMFPEEVAVACLGYIAHRGIDSAGLTMALWLTLKSETLTVLFDPTGLPDEVALKATAALKRADPDFNLKFLKAVEHITSPPMLMRALGLVPALGDSSILISWLRNLCHHGDSRVRARAAKMLCELRPNKNQIERQMQSEDPRIRGNAIEALWHSTVREAKEIFVSATRDTHHRVVANALVGLYFLGDKTSLDKMVKFCESPDPFFRAAMAWAFGFLADKQAIPTLQELTKDTSIMVRKRALKSLLVLQVDEPVTPAPGVVVSEAVPTAVEPAVSDSVAQPEEPPVSKPETDTRSAPKFTLF